MTNPTTEAGTNTRATPELLNAVAALVREANALVLSIYEAGFAVNAKADASPVTEADVQAEALITAGLQRLAPDIPLVAEEAVAAAGCVPDCGARFWLVDPLDGTREFVSRNGEFTVNVALIEHGEPVLGVVGIPVQGRVYAGARGQGAWVEDGEGDGMQGRRAIACRAVPAAGATVVASRSHGDEAALQHFLAGRQVAGIVHAGSSLKLCLIATGEADLYPRHSRTMEWDIAAGHAVLSAAGGAVLDLDGLPLRYGKPGLENPHFVARGL
jgi:3'(2'), 5'-bisphosphate nucleotidase